MIPYLQLQKIIMNHKRLYSNSLVSALICFISNFHQISNSWQFHIQKLIILKSVNVICTSILVCIVCNQCGQRRKMSRFEDTSFMIGLNKIYFVQLFNPNWFILKSIYCIVFLSHAELQTNTTPPVADENLYIFV